jgi:hypothetical protein
MKKLRINLEDLKLALEGDGFGADVAGHFLDTETGEVLTLCRDWEDYEELSARLDAGLGGRYRRIEPLKSGQSFRVMEDFAASLPESPLKSRLQDALTRSKPFRRFKDVLHSDMAVRDQWFAFQDDALAGHVTAWLEAMGVAAELQRR